MTELTFTPGERAIRAATPKAPAFECTIQGVKGRWVQIADIDGNVTNCGKADLSPVPPKAEEVEAPTKTQYTGPMLALRERAKRGIYQKAANGQPSCGDEVAMILGALKPEFVIKACIAALNLPGNPYLHLNIGQQSMNLRNKLRGALLRGEFGMGVVREAAEEALIDQNLAYIKSEEFQAATTAE